MLLREEEELRKYHAVGKFKDPFQTKNGSERAQVKLEGLRTLWFNTGTLCNLTCSNCYIESSPTNDRLVYINENEVALYIDEALSLGEPLTRVGLTGGEPFLNPSIIKILEEVLKRDIPVLVLTNGIRAIEKYFDALERLANVYGEKLALRISLDHFKKEVHEGERGKNTFSRTLKNMKILQDRSISLSLAGRSLIDEELENAVYGYQELLTKEKIDLKLVAGKNIVIFPEMVMDEDVPEISTKCWDILGKLPTQQMCASERMIVKRKGSERASVLPCTLLAYDQKFELGTTLKDSKKAVSLNHPYCSKFCVLGGASCSSTE